MKVPGKWVEQEKKNHPERGTPDSERHSVLNIQLYVYSNC